MNNEIKFLNKSEEHDIPSQILQTILDSPQYVWFPSHLNIGVVPDCSGQLAELIVCIITLEFICIVTRPVQVKTGVVRQQAITWTNVD